MVQPVRSFGDARGVWSVAFSPKNPDYLATGSSANVAKLWSIATGKVIRSFEGHTEKIMSVAISGGQLATGSKDRAAKLWDVETGTCVRSFPDHTEEVSAVAFSPGHEYLAATSDKHVKLWDCNTGKCLRHFRGHTKFVKSVAFSACGDQCRN